MYTSYSIQQKHIFCVVDKGKMTHSTHITKFEYLCCMFATHVVMFDDSDYILSLPYHQCNRIVHGMNMTNDIVFLLVHQRVARSPQYLRWEQNQRRIFNGRSSLHKKTEVPRYKRCEKFFICVHTKN